MTQNLEAVIKESDTFKLGEEHCMHGKKPPSKSKNIGSYPVTQWVKDPVLLQLWRRSQLCGGFDPWPRIFKMQQMKQKKKKKSKNTNDNMGEIFVVFYHR